MMSSTNPLFITFEGCEGCGKSTQSKMLQEHLLAKNIECILTREIGGTKEANEIRNLMLHSDLLPRSELLLVMAARCEHMEKVILPALNGGKWVICDRFVDSTACYQGQYPEIGLQRVYALHDELLRGVMPNITFFIDVPLKTSMQRALQRGDNNKFEEKDIAFHHIVHDSFCTLTKMFPQRIMRIKAAGLDAAEVHQQVLAYLTALCSKSNI